MENPMVFAAVIAVPPDSGEYDLGPKYTKTTWKGLDPDD